MPEPTEDHFLTLREAERLIVATAATQVERFEAHLSAHRQEAEALDKALAAESKLELQHNTAHDKAHDSHEEKHAAEEQAVKAALDGLDRERAIHSMAHDRAHESHQREHGLNNLAIDKAESATDKRFISVNGTRAQMEDMLRTLTSQDAFNALAADFVRYREESRKDQDRRFEEIRLERERRFAEVHLAITNIEKGDVKGEGKELGRNAMVALIVGAIGLVGTVLGILVVASNLATGQ